MLIWFLVFFHTGKLVRPKWKIPGKFIFYVAISWALTHWLGHWALIFILGHPLLGFIFHIVVCKKHHIDWRTCQPRDKYLALQTKWSKGDF